MIDGSAPWGRTALKLLATFVAAFTVGFIFGAGVAALIRLAL